MKILSVRFVGWAGLFYNSKSDHATIIFNIIYPVFKFIMRMR